MIFATYNAYNTYKRRVLLMNTFGEKLKKMRNDKNLSIRELAKRSGTSHPYLSQLETGKRNPPKPEMIKKLSDGLNVNFYELMTLAGYYDEKEAKLMSKTNEALNVMRNMDKQKGTGEIELPQHINFTDKNGVEHTKATTTDDVFDLFYLLNMNVDLYYNRFHGSKKPLTDEEKQKIKTMLQTILE